MFREYIYVLPTGAVTYDRPVDQETLESCEILVRLIARSGCLLENIFTSQKEQTVLVPRGMSGFWREIVLDKS